MMRAEIIFRLRVVKIICRAALGFVWLYEGLVPKLLFLRADELDLVRRSGLIWHAPEVTLQVLGVAQVALGLWLIAGIAERLATTVATFWMLILIVLVARGNPAMLTEPYGALAKDFCLVACAATVWALAPIVPRRNKAGYEAETTRKIS
jgi:uncharacterized membrane protein YphA (DoxX/SURF4 family)